uniref:C2H2-type domain-containing protein n=1 Tax=Glossina austeni TaxID=7395 RepID=A0A1A9VM83_GLOAU
MIRSPSSISSCTDWVIVVQVTNTQWGLAKWTMDVLDVTANMGFVIFGIFINLNSNKNIYYVTKLGKSRDNRKIANIMHTGDIAVDYYRNMKSVRFLCTRNGSFLMFPSNALLDCCGKDDKKTSHMRSCEASHLTCSLCEVGFLGWREYHAHFRQHGSDVKKPFFCLECGMRFMTHAVLTLHQSKYPEETPYLRPHCDKDFKWKQGPKTHLL